MGTQVSKQVGPVQEIKGLLEANADSMAAVLPKHITPQRLVRVVMGAMTKNPKLQDCTRQSLVRCVMESALTGLEPDGVESALIPFRNGKLNITECQLQPMVQGLIKLAHRTGNYKLLYAEVVRKGDFFEWEKGLCPKLVHKPLTGARRGDALYYYAVAQMENGLADFEVMDYEEVDKVRLAGKSPNAGPWVEWPDEMGKKTVMKRFLKRLPKQRDLQDAIEIDNGNRLTMPAGIVGLPSIDSVISEPQEIPEIEAPQEPPKVEPPKQPTAPEKPSTKKRNEADDFLPFPEAPAHGK